MGKLKQLMIEEMDMAREHGDLMGDVWRAEEVATLRWAARCVAAETERTAPTAVLEGAGAADSAGGGLEDDLQARLDALRK